jgi:hypothetical protein
MILGIIPDASTAEILLNNLSEAEFDLKDISVIMRDARLRKKIAKDSGPLKGVHYNQIAARLAQAGLDAQDAQRYQEAVAQGKVLVAMESPANAAEAAKEMFTDQSGENVTEVSHDQPKNY